MSKQKNKNFKYKKIITMIVFFVFLFSLITPMLLVPQPAQAGLNATITDLPRIIMDFFQKMYKKTSAFLYNQGLEKYTNKIAYDAAIALSSGKSGQKTDFITNPKEYYKRIGDGAAGDFLNNLATGKMGGVCNVTKGGKPLFRAPSEDEKNNASEDFVFCTKETEATVCPTVGVPRVCKYKPSLCKTDTDCPDYKNWTGISPMEAAMQGLKDPVPMKQYGKNGVEYTVEDECLAGKGKCLVPRIDLCETDLKLRAQIIGGIKGAAFEEVQPECPLSKISKHYKELKSRTKLEDWVDYQSYFNPNANDIGVQLSLMTKMYDKEAGAVIEEEKTIDNGIFSTKSLISKKIKTPAWIKKSWLGKVFTKGADEKKQTGNILADAFGVFAKTYASNFLKILMEKGFSNDDNPDLSDHGATGSTTSIKAAEKIYSSIFTPQIISGGNYDVLSNYLSCPDDLNFAQVDNCVIPQTMGTILQNNEKISFQDAIDAQDKYPWINFPVGKNKNGRILGKGDQDEGFSLANIKKMRLARIVPVGLEIAAQKLVDNTNISSKSLKEIVQGFNGPEGSNFYHLVDPNWILKSPQHQCGAKVFGSILEAPQSTQRGSICVDAKSCLKENADGTCAGAWGYCVREKNIWRFDGDECPERFNNCQTFQKETQAQVSYLKKTLDTVGCDSSNAGCLWYSKAYIEGKELCNKTKIATGDTVFNKCIKDNSLLSAKRIYFNKNVQTCNAKDDGCHEFIQLTDIKNEEYPLIITAQNVFNEVHKVGNTDDNYFNYAKENKIYLNKNRMQCDEANVGCEKYTPTNKEPWIPGIAKTENVCPKECVGYKSYHQLATNFENSVFPVDLIPNGKQCSISEAGCEEFTNLDELAKGGESKEYYTSLRQCVKPESTCGVFYTYFGSDTQGFQIKTYNLQKDGNVPKTTDNIGAEDCNSEEDAMNHPECKQFYDELGNISYKLYKKTISCSDDCHPLRKSGVTSMSECINKGGVWDGNKKQCIYMAIPSEGQTCSAGNMGCRAYRGIQGDNFRIVLQDNFEDKDSKGWVNASITSEAEAISGNSIKSEGTGALANLIKSSVGVMSDSLIQNKSYEISFWAKSGTETKQDVSVNFNNGTSEKIFFGIQSVSMEWNKYSFGPVLFNREVSENEILEIVGNVFVDNISLKEINDIYLIKNSWEVPASCAGENGSGSMLNCAEYQNRNGAFNYLKGFSSLCKEELIGCQALIDTQNSTFPYASVEIKGKTTASDVMAYFVNNPQNYCASQEKGCEALGLPELNASNGVKEDKEGNGIWRDVYLKNDPDFYTTTLCNSNETSCQEYKYGENNASILYFKDPGDKVCEYKLVTGETEYGWYQKGTESGKPNCECELKKISEQSEPKWYQRGTKNEYLNCKKNGDIISGWVGMCPKEQSSCTEFIDPLDNQSFYYLNNNKIDRTSPNGLVSKKEGKILFNDTSKKELIYNATATYELEKENKKAVSPVVCEKGSQSCTANTIIKVDRDRVCGQWLSCKNSTEIFNEGKKKNICDENGLCKKFADDTTSGCDEWVTANEGKNCVDDLECLSGKCGEKKQCEKDFALNEENYTKRNISWEGLDYSGYSIASQYPIYTLTQKDNSTKDLSDWRLIYKAGIVANGISKSCRAYPEATAPFSKNIVEQDGFQSASVCGEDGNNCECSYTKMETTNYSTSYFRPNTTTITGLCTEGSAKIIGTSCSSNKDCCDTKDTDCKTDNKGQCSAIKKMNQYLGWKGYCLENDRDTLINKTTGETACLTWFPVDLVNGETSADLDFPGAGFDASGLGFGSGPYYCLEKEGSFEYRTTGYGTDKNGLWGAGCGGKGCPNNNNGYIQYCHKRHTDWGAVRVDWSCTPTNGDGCYDKITNKKVTGINNATDCNAFKMCSKAVTMSKLNTGNINENKAWTDRFWQAKNKPLIKYSYNNLYTYNSLCEPFGALPASSTMSTNPIYLMKTGKICGIVEGSGLQGVNDYVDKNIDLKNIFAKSMGIYNWTNGHEAYTNKVCENDRDFFCKGDGDCLIKGACKANTCSNGLGILDTTKDSTSCRPNFDNLNCLEKVSCNNNECNDKNILCNSNAMCSSGICSGLGIGTPPAISGFCSIKSCNPNTDCKNIDSLKECKNEKNERIQVIKNNEKCEEDEKEGEIILDGQCRIEKYCINGIKMGEECADDLGCTINRGKCVESTVEAVLASYKEGNESWDVAETIRGADSVNSAPKIQAVKVNDSCDIAKNWCPGGDQNKFTVNNQTSKTIAIAGEKGFSAVVKFYAWADKDQMPIREIIIDWGDNSTKTITSAKIKNHKEKCGLSIDFGDQPQACIETYFQYSHIYTTTGTHTIKVSVKDNWGWCTNGKYAGDTKCLGDSFISGPTITIQ